MRLGRRIFDNLRKSMSYILAVHVPIAGMALLPVLLGWPAMLFPMHIAFLELIIDPACSHGVRERTGRTRRDAAPAARSARRRCSAAPRCGWRCCRAWACWPVVLARLSPGRTAQLTEPEARAFAFATLVIANLALIFSNRSRSRSLLASLTAPNPILWIVTGVTLGLLALSLYLPGPGGPVSLCALAARMNWPPPSRSGWSAWPGSKR